MLSGSLTYRSQIDGIEFDKIEIRTPQSSVEKIDVISDPGGNVSIEVHIGQIALLRDAKTLGLREARRVANRLTIALCRPCYDPIPQCHALRDHQADVHFFEDWTVPTPSVGSAKRLGTESVAELASALNEVEPPGEANYQRFRHCLNIPDVASRFLALHRLLGMFLAHTAQDTQAAIDDLIRKHEPEVAEMISPQTGKPETIYTKLRNEYMNCRDASLAQIQPEMADHLPGLIAILQKAIRSR
jgi:hypothetical protein